MYIAERIGTLTDVYTDTQYTTQTFTPRIGDWYYDNNLQAKFIFLKNAGSSAITANLVAVAPTTQKSAFTCQLGGVTGIEPFAGARVTGASSMAQNQYGWFQISGPATLTADTDDGTTADKLVVTTDHAGDAGMVMAQEAATAGECGPALAFGVAETTTASATVKVNLVSNVWGL